MKTLRLWKIVTVGVVLALFAAEVRADEKQDRGAGAATKQQLEQKARAALALAAAKEKDKAPRGFVNLAPVPRVIPEPMPAAKCGCGESCKCAPGQCPAECAAKKAEATTSAKPKVYTHVGWKWEQQCDGKGHCYFVQVPVYDWR